MDLPRIAVLFAVFFSLSAHAEMPDFFSEASSPNPNRAATSLAPNEIIDTFSGSLSLVHTDLVIPGQGGLDLRIQRSYSSNNVYAKPKNQPDRYNRLVRTNPYGLGWSLHFGRIRRVAAVTSLQLDPYQVCNSPHPDDRSNVDSPVLEMPDGSQRQLFCNTRPSAFSTNADFITKDHWAVTVMRSSVNAFLGYEVINPEGIKYTMDYRLGGGQFVDQPLQGVFYTTKIEDRNGNRLDIVYDSSSDLESPIFKRITSPDGRRVDFSYTSNTSPGQVKLNTISHENRVINYSFSNFTPDYPVIGDNQYRQLTRVQLPGGTSTGEWRYSYYNKAVGEAGDNNLRTVTFPLGATTTYDYKYVCILFTNCSTIGQFVSLVVDSKVNDGRDIARGTWDFDYSVSSDEAFNIVKITGPNSIEEYRHHKPPVRISLNSSSFFGRDLKLWKTGLLHTKTIRNRSNALLQSEAYEYDKRELSSEYYERPPFTYSSVYARDAKTYQHFLIRKTITREGTDYVTEYRDFNDNINPHRIVEQGQATRTRLYTFYPRKDGQNIVSMPATEQIGSTSSTNRRITRTFDNNGNMLSERRFGVMTRYRYDSAGNVIEVEDARGSKTKFSSYKLGVPRNELRPEGVSLSRTVDDFGNVVSARDGRGRLTQYAYDKLNRLEKIDPPQGATTYISWDTSRRTVSRGRYSQTVNFDGLGRTTCTNTNGVRIGIGYDALGNKQYETYPSSICNASSRTSFTYDALNRAKITTHADGSTQVLSYQSNNQHSLKDERNNVFVSRYRSYGDPDHRELMRVTGPASLNHSLQRNLLGQVTRITRNGVFRNFNYGTSIFVQDESHPETGFTTFGRDAVGNMISKKVGISGVTRYTYDRLNRLTHTNYPRTTTPDVTREYDKNNNLLRITSGIADLRYTYDDNDNLINEHQTIDGKSYYINYRYDDLDFLSSITNPDNSVITYAPNAFGWPTKAAPYVRNVTYNNSGQPLSIEYDNGRKTIHTYDRRLWPNVTEVDGGVSKRTRRYDSAGNMLSLTDNLRSQNNRTMTYDGLHRLKSAVGPWGGSFVNYNTLDDITAKRMGPSSDLSYQYDSTNRKITSVSGVQGIPGSTTIRYDVYGNVVQKSNSAYGWRYTFDDAVNLREVRDTASNVLRTYDYSGLRQRVRTIKPDETRMHIVNQQGQLLSEFVTNGSKPSIANVYLGNRLVAELELSSNNPDSVTGPGFGSGFIGTTVTRQFQIAEVVKTVTYCVDGYGIRSSNELKVEVNGQFVGYMKVGANGTTSCFEIPNSIWRIGSNTVVFIESGGDGVWGVGQSELDLEPFFNPAVIVPPVLLLLDDTPVSGQ